MALSRFVNPSGMLSPLSANVRHARMTPTSLAAAVEPCTGKIIKYGLRVSERG